MYFIRIWIPASKLDRFVWLGYIIILDYRTINLWLRILGSNAVFFNLAG